MPSYSPESDFEVVIGQRNYYPFKTAKYDNFYPYYVDKMRGATEWRLSKAFERTPLGEFSHSCAATMDTVYRTQSAELSDWSFRFKDTTGHYVYIQNNDNSPVSLILALKDLQGHLVSLVFVHNEGDFFNHLLTIVDTFRRWFAKFWDNPTVPNHSYWENNMEKAFEVSGALEILEYFNIHPKNLSEVKGYIDIIQGWLSSVTISDPYGQTQKVKFILNTLKDPRFDFIPQKDIHFEVSPDSVCIELQTDICYEAGWDPTDYVIKASIDKNGILIIVDSPLTDEDLEEQGAFLDDDSYEYVESLSRVLFKEFFDGRV